MQVVQHALPRRSWVHELERKPDQELTIRLPNPPSSNIWVVVMAYHKSVQNIADTIPVWIAVNTPMARVPCSNRAPAVTSWKTSDTKYVTRNARNSTRPFSHQDCERGSLIEGNNIPTAAIRFWHPHKNPKVMMMLTPQRTLFARFEWEPSVSSFGIPHTGLMPTGANGRWLALPRRSGASRCIWN